MARRQLVVADTSDGHEGKSFMPRPQDITLRHDGTTLARARRERSAAGLLYGPTARRASAQSREIATTTTNCWSISAITRNRHNYNKMLEYQPKPAVYPMALMGCSVARNLSGPDGAVGQRICTAVCDTASASNTTVEATTDFSVLRVGGGWWRLPRSYSHTRGCAHSILKCLHQPPPTRKLPVSCLSPCLIVGASFYEWATGLNDEETPEGKSCAGT